jgi:hypothetical protein
VGVCHLQNDKPRDVAARTRAFFDDETGYLILERSAYIRGLDEDVEWLPKAKPALSCDLPSSSRAVRIAVLAAMAWEKNVLDALTLSGFRANESEVAQP